MPLEERGGVMDKKDDKTVAMGSCPDVTSCPNADPEATQLYTDGLGTVEFPASDARDVDLNATQLTDEAPTVVASLRESAAPAEAPDGLDTLDDPYYSPAALEDLTTPHIPVPIPSPVQSLPERKRRLPRWAVALLVIVLLAAAGGAAYYTYEQEIWGGRTVPSVLGMSEDKATRALQARGFSVRVEYQSADDGFDSVLSCSPEPGLRADPSAGATIVVSAQRTIPPVVGMDVSDARQALLDAGVGTIHLTYHNSDQAEGTVLSVDPDEGETFTSSDTVTLTVARAYTVPDLEGMSLTDARAALEDEGLTASVTYVDSTVEKNTVVGTSPAAGEQVSSGTTVELKVSSPYPSQPWSLFEYFEATPQELSSYLSEQGFSLLFGELYAAGGNAHAAYQSAEGDVLQISDNPESGSYAGGSQADVLAKGAALGGVRYAFSTDSLPEGAASEGAEGVRAVMSACGFSGLADTCTQDDVTLPEGIDEDSERTHFICGYGRQDDYTWAVFIGGRDEATKVVALVAPAEHFSDLDLSAYGQSVCDYVAYVNLYEE